MKGHKAIVFFFCLTLLHAGVMLPVTAQNIPSQVRVGGSQGDTLNVAEYQSLFDALTTYAGGFSANLSQFKLSEAEAHYANYSKVASRFDALNTTNPEKTTVLTSIRSSKEDLRLLLTSSQRFDTLYNRRPSLNDSAMPDAGSINDTLEMRQLLSNMKAFSKNFVDQFGVIYAAATQNKSVSLSDSGLLSPLDAYLDQIDFRTAAVIDTVFQNTTTSISSKEAFGYYGNNISLSGAVKTGSTGVANTSVVIYLDKGAVGKTQTNETGSYTYLFPIDETSAGNHSFVAVYEPEDAPYKPSSSTVIVDVRQSNATIRQSSYSSLKLQDLVSVYGYVMAGDTPLNNAPVTLFVDNDAKIVTHTDEEGYYYVSYSERPVQLLASMFRLGNYNAYVKFDPGMRPLTSAQSEIETVPALGTRLVNTAGSGPGIAFIMVGASISVGGLLTYARRRSRSSALRRGPSIAEHVSLARELDAQFEPSAPPESQPVVPFELIPATEIEHLIERGRGSFASGKQQAAIRLLHGGVIALLEKQDKIQTAASMTHWEMYRAVEHALPALSRPMHTLTYLFEFASYAGEPVTEDQFNAAVVALFDIERRANRGEIE